MMNAADNNLQTPSNGKRNSFWKKYRGGMINMKKLFLLTCVVTLVFCFAIAKNSAGTNDLNQGQNTKRQTEKQFLNPSDLHMTGGYTHVVTANQGKMIFVAGQVALNKQLEVVGKGDLRAQTTQVFENLKVELVAAGATFADVVKMNIYVPNYKPTDVHVIREVRSKYVSKEKPPAATLVGVQSLVREDFLIEIEVIALIDQ
jgi:enamine deaminase RidA (YjgF/YER057c/UK114 family)